MSLIMGLLRSDVGAATRGNSFALMCWQAFEVAINHSLRLVHDVHIPVSLFAVRLAERKHRAATEVIGQALAEFGMVGLLSEGSIGLLYLGPHRPGGEGDAALTESVVGRIAQRLQEQGWAALCPSLKVMVAHGWTDEINGSADLVVALAQRRV